MLTLTGTPSAESRSTPAMTSEHIRSATQAHGMSATNAENSSPPARNTMSVRRNDLSLIHIFLHGGRLLEYGESARLFDHPATPELQRFLGKLLEWSIR